VFRQGIALCGMLLVAACTKQGSERGQQIWESQRCAACHELGRRRATGPDLVGVTDRRSVLWLERWLQNPVAMTREDSTAKALKQQYNAQMPNLGLSPQDADSLITYLARETERRRAR
jgi:cytochrome c2